MTEQDLLNQLADIAEPASVSWWPPAPGWWILALLALIAVVTLSLWLLLRNRRNRFRKRALADLTAIQQLFANRQTPLDNEQAYLKALNELLKRTAITRYGRDRVSALHGQAWCRFLTDQARGLNFTDSPGNLFAEGLYRPVQDLPTETLHNMVRDWIRRCR